MQDTDTLASVAAALDAMDPLDQPTMGLNDLETVAELDAWRPGMLWCPDTLRLLEPTPWDTYRELPPSALQAALAGLNAGRRGRWPSWPPRATRATTRGPRRPRDTSATWTPPA